MQETTKPETPVLPVILSPGAQRDPNFPDIHTNFATDENVIAQIIEQVVPVMYWCKNWRRTLEEEWRAIRRMLLLQHDEGQRYIGRSNAYVPVYARSLEVIVSQLARGLFPSDEYMDVTARGLVGVQHPEISRPVKDYLQYEFEKVAKLRTKIKPFLREFVNFGISVAKVWYEPKELAARKIPKLDLKKIGDLMTAEPSMGGEYTCEGLRFLTRSIFSWHIYPFTVDDIRQATLIFEDIDVSRQHIREMARLGLWENTDDAINAPIDSWHNFNQQQQMLETVGNSTPTSNGPLNENEVGDHRTIQEVWVRLKLPKKAYALDEDSNAPVLCKVTMAGVGGSNAALIFEVRRHPFWHGEFPYLVARQNVLPGSFYPKGVGHLARSLQYLVNDFTNQLNDNGTYALNPVAKVNPGVLAGPLPPLKPGAVWPMTDTKDGVIFDRPPIEQIQYGITLVSQYAGMVQDFTGAPNVLQGGAANKAAKTATGAQILQANAKSPLQDLVEDIENEVMQPLMWMTWMLGQQFRSQPIMDEIAGAPIKVERSMLGGDYIFRWLASSQAANQQQRAQQAISLLQAIQPLIPYLPQLGYILDPVPLLRKIYSDGFGFRGFDQFVKPMQAMQQMGAPGMGAPSLPPGGAGPGQGAMPQQAPNMIPEDVAGNIRSALEQLVGGSPMEMQEGEGQDFANVRDNADEMAGMFGGLK